MWILLKNYYTANRKTFSWLMMLLLSLTSLAYLINHFIFFFMVLFSTFLFIPSLIQTEEKNHTDILYRSLPIKPSSIVYSRYIAAAVLFAGVFLLEYLACFLIEHLGLPGRTGPSPVITVAGFFTIAVPIAVLVAGIFPFYFKYGIGKGMLWGTVASILVCGTAAVILFFIFSLSGKTGIMTAVMAQTDQSWINRFLLGVFEQAVALMGQEFFLAFISIITVILLAISVKVSVRFYNNRDL